MGRTELFAHFAERFGIRRADAREFFDELQQLTEQELLRCGEFVLPGVAKLVVQKRERRMGRNPATGAPWSRGSGCWRLAISTPRGAGGGSFSGRRLLRPVALPVRRAAGRPDHSAPVQAPVLQLAALAGRARHRRRPFPAFCGDAPVFVDEGSSSPPLVQATAR